MESLIKWFKDNFENTKMKTYRLLNVDEQIALMKKEIDKIEHEIAICELVYGCHGEDTYEDLFRDNIPSLKEKIHAILLAIKNLENGWV
jgi:hypothetical protein